MSIDLKAARAQLVARMVPITGLQTYAYLPASPETPCVVVEPELITRTAFDPDFDVSFRVQVLVSMTDWPTAQALLDSYISSGPTSIIEAVELDGSIRFDRVDGYGHIPIGESDFATVSFHFTFLS